METSRALAEPAIPRLAGETPLLGSLPLLRRDPWGLFLRVMRECGDIGIFHIGPLRSVQVTTAEHAHELLVRHHADLGRGFLVRRTLAATIGATLSTYEGDEHRRRRQLMAPVFTPGNVSRFADTMVAETERAISGWRDGAEVELSGEIKRLSMRVSAKVFMGADLPVDLDPLIAAATDIDRYLTYALSRVRPVPLAVPTGLNRRTRRAQAALKGAIHSVVRQRRGDDPRDDLLGVLLGSGELGETEIVDELTNIFINFFPTTATVIWPLYLLATHETQLRAVQREVDEALGGRSPTKADLVRLPLATAVYQEAMRLYPFVPDIMRVARRAFALDGGNRIRKGDLIHVATYAMHRRDDYFPDPERFDPGRFSAGRKALIPRWGFIPFGIGPHVCIGNHFSMLQGPLLIATILQRVAPELVPGQTIRPNARASLMMMPENGMWMRMRRRSGAWVSGAV